MSIHNLPNEMENARFPDSAATPLKLFQTVGGLCLFAYGTTVPSAGTAGYLSGALFMDTNAAGGTDTTSVLWVNDGSGDSCSFVAANLF